MTDFDILNYSVEELINIIGLGGQVPLANEQIEEKIKALKEQFEDKYLNDEEIIKVNLILRTFSNNTITDADFIASGDFKTELVRIINYGFPGTTLPGKKERKWNDWSRSNFASEFKTQYYKLLNSNVNFKEYMALQMEEIDENDIKTALDDAFKAKEEFIFFFDEIANKLREYKKDESALDYYKEEEENEKSLLEGDFMDETETVLAQGNIAMPLWERTTFKPGSTIQKDYKNPLLKTIIHHTINIDSQYRSIADPVVCIRCPDSLEIYKENKNKDDTGNIISSTHSGSNPVVSSNSDGSKLIVGISGNKLYNLESFGSVPLDISFNKLTPEGNINKEWVDITMNYRGSSIAVCNKKYIWYSISGGDDNSWHKSEVSVNLSNVDISANWTAITSDFTGKNLFATRSASDVDGRVFKNNGVCYSTDYAKTWVDLSGVIKLPEPYSTTFDMSQNWIDIAITGDGKKVYGIYKKDSKYYITKKVGDSWNVINKDIYISNAYLTDYSWNKIVTNFYGNKVFVMTNNQIWRSFNSGVNWSKIIIPNPTTEWTLTIEAQDITQSVGAAVTQGYVSGTLKTALTGTGMTSVVIASSATFVSGVQVVIGTLTTIIPSNVISATKTSYTVIHSLTCSLDGLKLAIWTENINLRESVASLRFSENGGDSWNDASTLQGVTGPANIVISGDGDRILGLDYDGNIFTSKKCIETELTMFDRPSNFTLNLSEPIKNILSMSFKSIELPHAWNAFNKNEGTNVFYIKMSRVYVPITIEIPENNYHYSNAHDIPGSDSLNLITALNEAVNKALNKALPDEQNKLVFIYKGSHNISITNNTKEKITLFWHYEDGVKPCGYSGLGTRVNYNLGTLLGFRKTLTVLPVGVPVPAPAKLNLNPNKYVFISLDEFTNNKSPDTCISYENNSASFNMPSYYVKTTMGAEMDSGKIEKGNKCWVKDDEVSNCGKKRANPDLLSNLTSKQRYTIQNLRNAITGPKNNQYRSPIIPNLLDKVQLQYDNSLSPSLQYTARGIESLKKKRDYFGPITLRKFHIRLLNERGNEIDMNNNDWSFSLIVNQLCNK
tara:strand:- start:3702 stop:6902 length:3201 start_codon:yes stop_codon:yes gene_type:complete